MTKLTLIFFGNEGIFIWLIILLGSDTEFFMMPLFLGLAGRFWAFFSGFICSSMLIEANFFTCNAHIFSYLSCEGESLCIFITPTRSTMPLNLYSEFEKKNNFLSNRWVDPRARGRVARVLASAIRLPGWEENWHIIRARIWKKKKQFSQNSKWNYVRHSGAIKDKTQATRHDSYELHWNIRFLFLSKNRNDMATLKRRKRHPSAHR